MQVLPMLALAAAATGGVMAAREQSRAGRFAQAQSEIDAKAEGDAARQREIERKRGLLRAISSQQAYAAAAGISTSEGSPARLAQLDTALASSDLNVDTANTRARQAGLLSQGRAARFRGDTQATMTLLDTAVRAYHDFGGKK